MVSELESSPLLCAKNVVPEILDNGPPDPLLSSSFSRAPPL